MPWLATFVYAMWAAIMVSLVVLVVLAVIAGLLLWLLAALVDAA